MITRIRIEGRGATAAEVEAHMNAIADALDEKFDLQSGRGGQFIQRDAKEPDGYTAFTGKMTMYPNVASDSGQVAALSALGMNVSVLPTAKSTWFSVSGDGFKDFRVSTGEDTGANG